MDIVGFDGVEVVLVLAGKAVFRRETLRHPGRGGSVCTLHELREECILETDPRHRSAGSRRDLVDRLGVEGVQHRDRHATRVRGNRHHSESNSDLGSQELRRFIVHLREAIEDIDAEQFKLIGRFPVVV